MLQTLWLWVQIPQSELECSRERRVGPHTHTDLKSDEDRHSAVAWRLPPTPPHSSLSPSLFFLFPSHSLPCSITISLSPLLYPPLSLCVRVFNCAVIPECGLLGCLTLDITYMFIFHSVSPRFAQAHGFPWILFLKSLMRKPLVEWDSVIITT